MAAVFAREEQDDEKHLKDAIDQRYEVNLLVELVTLNERTTPADHEESAETIRETSITLDLEMNIELTEQLSSEIIFTFDKEDGLTVDMAKLQLDIAVNEASDNTLHGYLQIGKMNLPFGRNETHLLSDSLTQQLGESMEYALVLGIENPFMAAQLALFEGDLGKSKGSHRNKGLTGSVAFTLPHEISNNNQTIFGVSHHSNIADSNELTRYILDEYEIQTLEKHVSGNRVFASFFYHQRFFMAAEYTRTSDFFDQDPDFKPSVTNLEFAYLPSEPLVIAFRYATSHHAKDFLPKNQ